MKGLVSRNTHVNIKALSLLGRRLWSRLKFFKSRSRSRGQKFWHHVKGLVTMNTHVQYQSPITSEKKGLAKIKVFSKVGQTSRSRSPGQKLWYHMKGFVTRNKHVQHQSPFTSGKKVMAKVKVFVYAHTPTPTPTPGL